MCHYEYTLYSHAHHHQQRDYTGTRLRSSSGSGYRGQEPGDSRQQAAYPGHGAGARSQSFLDLHHAEETADTDQELDRDRGWRQRSYGVSDADLERAARWEL